MNNFNRFMDGKFDNLYIDEEIKKKNVKQFFIVNYSCLWFF